LIEVLDLNGNGNSLINFTDAAITNWSTENISVTIDGGGALTVNAVIQGDNTNIVRDEDAAAGTWTATGDTVTSTTGQLAVGGASTVYDVFTRGTQTVLIQQGINTSDLTGAFVAPIVIDLDGDGVEFVGLDAGIELDVTGDGIADQTAFAGRDDGILVYDADGNGQISGVEEFIFTSYVEGAQTDLEGLAFFDTNQNGLLDQDDQDYSRFAVFQDTDGDAQVDTGEFVSLDNHRIISIDLVSDQVISSQADGDVIVSGTTQFTFADGSTADVADAAFRFEEKAQISKTVDDQDQNAVVRASDSEIYLDLTTIGNALSIVRNLEGLESGDEAAEFSIETLLSEEDNELDNLLVNLEGTEKKAVEQGSFAQVGAQSSTSEQHVLSALEMVSIRQFPEEDTSLL